MTYDLAHLAERAFTDALAISRAALATGCIAGLFARLGRRSEDELVAEAHDIVLDALSDADQVGVIDCVTDRNLRDQVTVEEAIELHEDREERRGWWKWN